MNEYYLQIDERLIPLTKEKTTIGSDRGKTIASWGQTADTVSADIVLSDSGLSRINTSILFDHYFQNSQISIVDENSTNGTFVNGQRIQNEPVQIRSGDTIKIGLNTEIILVQHELSMPQSSAHQIAAMPLHNRIVYIFGFLALCSIGGGIYAIFLGSQGDTKLKFLSAELSTTNVGVALVGIGFIITFFTIRSVMKNQLALAALPSEKKKKKSKKSK